MPRVRAHVRKGRPVISYVRRRPILPNRSRPVTTLKLYTADVESPEDLRQHQESRFTLFSPRPSSLPFRPGMEPYTTYIVAEPHHPDVPFHDVLTHEELHHLIRYLEGEETSTQMDVALLRHLLNQTSRGGL